MADLPEEHVSPEQLAEAFWGHYLAAYGPDPDEERKEALFWTWMMVEAIVCGYHWEDDWAEEEQRPARLLAPEIDRLALLELLAETAPDTDEALGLLGAGPLEEYLGEDPNLELVEAAAKRDERFRIALNGAWYNEKLSPQDAERLRKFGGHGGPGGPD